MRKLPRGYKHAEDLVRGECFVVHSNGEASPTRVYRVLSVQSGFADSVIEVTVQPVTGVARVTKQVFYRQSRVKLLRPADTKSAPTLEGGPPSIGVVAGPTSAVNM